MNPSLDQVCHQTLPLNDNSSNHQSQTREDSKNEELQREGDGSTAPVEDQAASRVSNNTPKKDISTLNTSTVLANAFDVLGDRRKRIKISQEPDEKPQHAQGQNSASTSRSATGDFKVTLQESTEASTHAQPSTGAESNPPKRRRGRPPKFLAAQAQDLQPTNARQSENDLISRDGSSTPKMSRTSRRKTMQIGANGKLFDTQSKTGMANSPGAAGRLTTKGSPKTTNVALKNEKFKQSMVVVMRYRALSSDVEAVGNRIEEISSRPPTGKQLKNTTEVAEIARKPTPAQSKATHPFFLGKAKQVPSVTTSEDARSQTAEEGSEAEAKKPVAWKDLVFKAKKPVSSKDQQLQKPPWPPLPFQHVSPESVVRSPHASQKRLNKQKSKAAVDQVHEDENILEIFSSHLLQPSATANGLKVPQKLQRTAREAVEQMLPNPGALGDIDAVSKVRDRALHHLSAFDRAEAPGPLPWTQKYAPARWEEVLQPDCHSLYNWLRGLAVHNVKQGLDPARAKAPPKKKGRQKKKIDDLDDFIVDSSDDEPQKTKNAILIVGPNGCGKTASVYAVARQLDFEVFEIHPGMRRSQKDIFEKVGDMAQNHMVQGGPAVSRNPSTLGEAEPLSNQEDAGQPSVTSFFGGAGGNKLADALRPAAPQPGKEQRQSLILFEEVDQIFEDDRGFWAGVQNLIQNSKRPVVLTCNTLHDIPIEELDLHTILEYTTPAADIASTYLTYIAAAEGHLLKSQAVQTLYRTKGNDLRSTMTALDFWCQMTIGSQKGGLDWYPDSKSLKATNHEQNLRTFSKDSYFEGLDILPSACCDNEQRLRFLDECLDIQLDDLSGPRMFEDLSNMHPQRLSEIFDTLSAIETLDQALRPLLTATLLDSIPSSNDWLEGGTICEAEARRQYDTDKLYRMFDCLRPLEADRLVFPPAQGRLAPSLDAPNSLLAIDIAPYVRSVAAFDLRLEQTWEEFFSSQGKRSRTTRAARAAAEGGDKSSTRREKWFPPTLDLQSVLRTGNNWPQWIHHDSQEVSSVVSPAEQTDIA